ncbi:DUF2922 domain-containing protein [Peptoniphilus catoniae]|uniref:DUF2922 domain-containing protein n=1 Tax=Peptoniphilus catoniae TaxID=1660341 RepID=UPI0010FCEAA2|nr:DUF2922 domain-containing protein [Peptoniphilus catoniae]
MGKKTLELNFLDENDKSLRFSIANPKEGINKAQLVGIEDYIVKNEMFVGPSGKLKGFGTAKYREVTETDLLA